MNKRDNNAQRQTDACKQLFEAVFYFQQLVTKCSEFFSFHDHWESLFPKEHAAICFDTCEVDIGPFAGGIFFWYNKRWINTMNYLARSRIVVENWYTISHISSDK